MKKMMILLSFVVIQVAPVYGQLGLDVGMRLNGGGKGKWKGERPGPDPDWRNDLNPKPSWQMNPATKETFNVYGTGFEIMPTYRIGNFRLGLPVSYEGKREKISETTVNWFDTITLADTIFERKGFALGVEGQLFFKKYFYLKARYSWQKVSATTTYYKGVDVYGRKNYSVPVSSKKIFEGNSSRIDLGIGGIRPPFKFEPGIYYERLSANYSITGFYLIFGLSGGSGVPWD